MTTTTRKTTKYSSFLPEERLPNWIKPSIGKASQLEKVQNLVKESRLHTICEEGKCPNRGECYAAGTATFLLGGSICTRSCAFCQVEKGKSPEKVNIFEPQAVTYVCGCSKEKCLAAIAQIEPSEIRAILAEQGKISMTCDYCLTTYDFDELSLQSFISKVNH